MRCLLAGVAPQSRHDGSPFTPYDEQNRTRASSAIPRAGLAQVRGDWEALAQFFSLRSYSSDFFCWQCNATKSEGPYCYRNFSVHAPHRQTLISHRDYIENCALEGGEPCYLFQCPGFELWMLVVDSMHSADLGCFGDALGSLFFLEITNRAKYPSMAEGMKSLNVQLDAFYRANPRFSRTKITPLALQQVIARKPGYPFLKGKAAQVRQLAEFGLILALKHQNGWVAENGVVHAPFAFSAKHRLHGHTAEHLRLQVELFQSMCGYTRSLAAETFDEDMCRESMLGFLDTLSTLNTLWRRGLVVDSAKYKSAPYHLRRKAHMLQHLVLDHIPVFGCPTLFWCYRDEDFVGAVKAICAKCKHPATLESKVLQCTRILEGLGFDV